MLILFSNSDFQSSFSAAFWSTGDRSAQLACLNTMRRLLIARPYDTDSNVGSGLQADFALLHLIHAANRDWRIPEQCNYLQQMSYHFRELRRLPIKLLLPLPLDTDPSNRTPMEAAQ